MISFPGEGERGGALIWHDEVRYDLRHMYRIPTEKVGPSDPTFRIDNGEIYNSVEVSPNTRLELHTHLRPT